MLRIFVVFVTLSWCIVGVAAATVVEVPLAELSGRYYDTETYQRTAPFHLLPIPVAVHSASLRLVGTLTIRLTYCDFDPFPQMFVFEANLPDPTTGGTWGAGLISDANGSFDQSIVFSTRSGASWEGLETGIGEVILSGTGCPVVDGCWPLTLCSEAFVDQAYLVVDAEFPIPVGEATWGRIKALFESSK
jgi:hypothetical protein